MSLSKKKLNIEYAIVQASYWMSHCVCVSFAIVFLQGRGYSNFSSGIVMACGNILGFLLSPYLAQLVDRRNSLNVFHCSWLLVAAQGLFLTAFVLIPGNRLIISVLYALYVASHISLNPMNTQLCFELDRWTGEINYGVTRSMGCVGYAVASLILGFVVESFGSSVIPVAGLVILAIQIAILSLANIQNVKTGGLADAPTKDGQQSSATAAGFIRKNPRFFILLLGMALAYFVMSLAHNFQINVVRNVGGDTAVMGTLSSYTAIIELIFMISYSWMSKRFRCASMLRVAMAMYFIKALIVALAPNIFWLYAGFTLNGPSYAMMTPALVHYTSLAVSPADSAKGQALSYSTLCLGTALASVLGGIMYDALSVRTTLLIGAAICAVGLIISQIMIDDTKQQRIVRIKKESAV